MTIGVDYAKQGTKDQTIINFYDEEGTARPIISNHVTKNKLSGFRGKIYYRFYSEQLRFEECDDEEQQKFRKQIRE